MIDNYLLKIGIIFNFESKVLKFGAEELKCFLQKKVYLIFENEGSSERKESFDRIIKLVVDKKLQDTSFIIKSGYVKNIPVLELIGHNESAVINAIYTFLENIGIKFEITGPIIPKKLKYSRWEQFNCHIVPAVKHRGIRQHINFPMDISSYTIEDISIGKFIC